MKILIKFYIVSACLLYISNGIYAQNKIAHYSDADIFAAYGNPITIGIFEIDGLNSLSKSLWDSLKIQDNWRERFAFYPSETLESLKDIYDIESFDYKSISVLNKLNEELGLTFVLAGEQINDKEVVIYLVDTNTGNIFYKNTFKQSKNSTILGDIIKLFNDQEITSYKVEIKNLPDLVLVEKGEVEYKPIRYKADTLIIKKDFYISKYECTLSQFNEFIQNYGYKTDAERERITEIFFNPKGDSRIDSLTNWRYDEKGEIRTGFDTLDYPVIYVSWNDAMQYCNWLSEETGEVYRLPTIDEWKYASIGGIHTENYIYSGSNEINEVGWYIDNSDEKLHLVGTKKPNEIGLYDMSGNVREWCLDLFKTDDTIRKVANGSWLDLDYQCNNQFSHRLGSNFRSNIIGFRVLKEIR